MQAEFHNDHIGRRLFEVYCEFNQIVPKQLHDFRSTVCIIQDWESIYIWKLDKNIDGQW